VSRVTGDLFLAVRVYQLEEAATHNEAGAIGGYVCLDMAGDIEWRVEIVIAAALDLIGGSLGDIASRCAPPLRARGGTV